MLLVLLAAVAVGVDTLALLAAVAVVLVLGFLEGRAALGLVEVVAAVGLLPVGRLLLVRRRRLLLLGAGGVACVLLGCRRFLQVVLPRRYSRVLLLRRLSCGVCL